MQSGLEIEFGFVAPEWASTDPLDEGTARRRAHGWLTLHDPTGVLASLIAVARAT